MLTLLMLIGAVTAPAPAPEMHVWIQDLDFSRPAHIHTFTNRVRDASRAYCAAHIAVVTPDRLGTPGLCQSEMRRLAVNALPDAPRAALVQSGQLRRLR